MKAQKIYIVTVESRADASEKVTDFMYESGKYTYRIHEITVKP